MINAHFETGFSPYRGHRDSLLKFIARLPEDAEFDLFKWLETLETSELRRIEVDGQKGLDCDTFEAQAETVEGDLVDIALTAYIAERRYELDTDEALYYLDSLLIGLAVAACIERLTRAGWVTITGKIDLLLKGPQPYHATKKGLEEGLWSPNPMTLWVLGTHLVIH